jgi:hypothetical protein
VIRGQQFDNTVISEDDSQTGSLVEIVDSGTIQVIEGVVDEDDEEEGTHIIQTLNRLGRH